MMFVSTAMQSKAMALDEHKEQTETSAAMMLEAAPSTIAAAHKWLVRVEDEMGCQSPNW